LSAVLLALAAIAGFILLRAGRTTAPNSLEYTQLTNFVDSVTSPAISPDGRMLTFIRGEETFVGKGEIYVKLLPDGEPVQLTHDGLQKMSPVFSPDGTRIAYTAVAATIDPTANRFPWDTWIVPVLGGEPRRTLSNAAALTWTPADASHKRILFSEWEQGIHMAVVSSAENRTDARTVYAPASINGMAHRAYLSPDRKSLLIAEMDGGWTCRLASYDGRSSSTLIGPTPSQCTTAAWSPDGKWMYFSANTGNGYHIWRQRFPNGVPEQITFGASEEQGIAMRRMASLSLPQWEHGKVRYGHTMRAGSVRLLRKGSLISPPIISWSRDGRFLYLHHNDSNETWTVPLQPGQMLPPLPPKGVDRTEDFAALPGAHLIPQAFAFAGSNPDVYTYARVTTHRNIYRVSIP
jgi:hypothetical protein